MSSSGSNLAAYKKAGERPVSAPSNRSRATSSPAGLGRFRSLMSQWAAARLSDIGAFGCLRSLRARMALDGVSWVQGGSVEIAVGHVGRVPQNRRRHLLPPWASLRSRARLDLRFVDAAGFMPV